MTTDKKTAPQFCENCPDHTKCLSVGGCWKEIRRAEETAPTLAEVKGWLLDLDWIRDETPQNPTAIDALAGLGKFISALESKTTTSDKELAAADIIQTINSTYQRINPRRPFNSKASFWLACAKAGAKELQDDFDAGNEPHFLKELADLAFIGIDGIFKMGYDPRTILEARLVENEAKPRLGERTEKFYLDKAALESKSSTKDESLEALSEDEAVHAVWKNTQDWTEFEIERFIVAPLYKRGFKLIADAKEQGKPKETKAES